MRGFLFSAPKGLVLMQTHFASPERTPDKELHIEIDVVSKNPIISQMLQSVGGLLAVLDQNRQIVSINDTFLHMLGVKDPDTALGLRLGEAVNCIHAHEETAGCGTSRCCSSCGAAIAIVSSLEKGLPSEQTCSISTEVNGNAADLVFSVRAYPLQLNNAWFVLLFLQDITADHQRAALARTFFHDVNNMLQMLVGASELLVSKENSSLSRTVLQAAVRLQNEIAIQRCLSYQHSYTYQPLWETISTAEILENLQHFFKIHPLSTNKKIDFIIDDQQNVDVTTDQSLLWRILHNMLLNALEAVEEGQKVKLWIEKEDSYLAFKVWNTGKIADDVAHRIFERNFTTKAHQGRGLGTYSMKYFGEKVLNGKVSFTSTDEDGTTFILKIIL